MIMISLIAAALAAAQYDYTPPAGASRDDSPQGGFDAAPFAQVYRKCFQEAEAETKAATADVKQQKFDACRGNHDAIVEHVTAKLDRSEAADVKRALGKAFHGVEKSYAKRMGVATPEGSK